MLAPSLAKRRATARPRRFPAPVTRATFPWRGRTFAGSVEDILPRNNSNKKVAHSTWSSIRREGAPCYNRREHEGEAMNLDVLAIAAHPDDVELTCGGTLLKMADSGYATGILHLTAGEMGTRGTPETRAKEAAKAAKILRVAHRENLLLPDAHLEVTKERSEE